MNPSTSLSLLGPIGNNPQAVPGPALENLESAFADSLLAALSGPFASSVGPAPIPVAQSLDTLTPALPTGTETNGVDPLLSADTGNLAAPLLGAEFGAGDDLLANVMPALDTEKRQTPAALLPGLQTAAPENTENPALALTNSKNSDLALAISKNPAPALATVENPDLAPAISKDPDPGLVNGKKSVFGAENIENHDFPPAINPAKGLRTETGPLISLPASSFPLSDTPPRAYEALSAIKGERTTSTFALTTTAVMAPNGTTPAVPILPQLRQALSSRADQPSTDGVTSEPTLQRGKESPVAPSKAPVNRDNTSSLHSLIPKHSAPLEQSAFPEHNSSPDRAGWHPTLQPSHTVARNNGPLSNAEHLVQVRAQAIDGQKGDNTMPLFRPMASAAAPNIALVEVIGSDSQPTAEPMNVTSLEAGRAEPVAINISKPSVHPTPPPNTQIALHIARAIPQGIDRLAVHLHPAELGAVEIQLDFTVDGRVSALITAERPETLDMLQRDSRTLERSLNDTGLRLDNGGLSFSLKQEQNQQGQSFNASSDQHSHAYLEDQDHDGGENNPSGQEPVLVSRHRLLDIRT